MEPEVRKLPIRFFELDLLRFLAALSVVVYHYTFLGYNEGHLSPVRYETLEPVTKYGYLAVELFFCISGYVVLLSAQGKTVTEFFISRATRLYPAYWIACTSTALCIYWFGPAPGELAFSKEMYVSGTEYVVNMTMLQRFLGFDDLDGSYWSLGVEISFYFIISVLIGWRLLHRLDIVLTVWLLYTALVRSAGATRTPFFYLLFPEYSSFFAAGMLFFLLQKRMYAPWKLYSLLTAAYVLGLRSALAEAASFTERFHTSFLPVVIVGLISAIFLIFFLLVFRVFDLSSWPWLAALGSITYSLYLLHAGIGYLLFQHFAASNKYVLLAVITATMLAAAYLLNRCVEKQISQQLKRILIWLID